MSLAKTFLKISKLYWETLILEHLANLKLDIWESFAQCCNSTVIGLENSHWWNQ